MALTAIKLELNSNCLPLNNCTVLSGCYHNRDKREVGIEASLSFPAVKAKEDKEVEENLFFLPF